MTGFDIGSLNEEQRKVLEVDEGPILVTAGAGSGKTRLLTHRIAHLIRDLDVRPYQILAITFTNKAAEEMRNRLSDMVQGAQDLWVMTFHAFCVRILRRDIGKLGYTPNFSIYSDTETDRVLRRILSDEKKDKDKRDDDFLKTVRRIISYAKNNNISPDALDLAGNSDEDRIRDAYLRYEQELKASNALDFDDLLTKAYSLLVSESAVLEYYQNKFRFIHIDEFQDTNTIQYQFIRLLALKHKNIFAVGDEDQSIYGWRGANIRNIYSFIDDFKPAVFKLEQNYRSTKKILETANRIISCNKERMPKNLWTENADGVRVESYVSQSESAEADYVIGTINALVDYSGYRYSDFAILMRVNALTRSFEERLIYYNLPYKIFGGQKFYERKEIKDILAYLRLISNPCDKESLTRIINYPKRAIGEVAVAKILTYCNDKKSPVMDIILHIRNEELPAALIKKITPFSDIMLDLYHAAKNKPLDDLVVYVINRIELKAQFAERNEENINRLINIDNFIASVQDFAKNNPEAGLDEYLQSVTLYADGDEAEEENSYVNLATMHAAKGLEFKVVFIVGLEEGLFPLARASESQQELEEERRLMYVAVTRARERLYLTRADTRYLYGSRQYRLQSKFWNEARGEIDAEKKVNMRYADDDSISFSDAPNNNFKKYVSNTGPAKKSATSVAFHVGDTVKHKKFGQGTIEEINGEGDAAYASVNFGSVGKIALALAYAPLEKV